MTTPYNFFPRLLCVFGTGLSAVAPAHAQDNKLSTDLANAIASLPTSGRAPGWVNGQGPSMRVKVLINAQSADPTLAALHAEVVRLGGTVYQNYVSVRAGTKGHPLATPVTH